MSNYQHIIRNEREAELIREAVPDLVVLYVKNGKQRVLKISSLYPSDFDFDDYCYIAVTDRAFQAISQYKIELKKLRTELKQGI